MEKVERVQYQAALAFTGAWYGSSRTKLYEELGWESLSDRRRCRRVLQVNKIYNNQTPYYLTDKLPPKSRSLFNGNNRNTFRSIICKSNRYMNSFFPDAITSWNTFATHFDDVPSFVTHKDYMNTSPRPNANSIFGIHDPKCLSISIFQLRVRLSSLRSHKFRHNFDDTPTDICSCNQGIQYTNHFLSFCPTYIMPRATLAASVTNI